MKTILKTPLVLALAVLWTAGCQQASQQREPVTPTTTRVERATPPPPAASKDCSAPTGGLVALGKQMPKEAHLGETFEYQLTVAAQECVGNVIVVDQVPAGASYVRSEPAAETSGDRLTWQFKQMDTGQKGTIRVWLKAEKEGMLASCATVAADPRVCAATFVGKAVLAIDKSGPPTAILGSTVSYTVVVTNTGTTVARGVVVTDTVPDGLESADGRKQITYTIGDLAPQQTHTNVVQLKAATRGEHCNTAVATSSNAGEVSDKVCTTVLVPGLKIAKSGTAEQILGRNADYEIVVSNTGDTALTNVVVTDTAPAATRILAATGASIRSNTATWTIPTMPAGDKKTFSVRLTSQTAGNHCNNVTAAAAGLRESAQACTVWKGIAAVLLEVVDDPDPIQVGENSVYTFKITNQGFADIHNVKIVGTFDGSLTPVGTSGATISGQTVTSRTVATMVPKEVLTGTVTVKGAKVGDSRSRFLLTCDELATPVEESESTHVY